MIDTPLQRLRDDAASASEVVAPSWPLSSIIACNPLSGFEHLRFDDALQHAEALFGARGLLTLDDYREAFASGRIDQTALGLAMDRRPGHDTTDLVHGDQEVLPERTALTVAEQHDRRAGTQMQRRVESEIADWCAWWSTRPEPGDFWMQWRAAHPERSAGLPTQVDEALRAALGRLRVPRYAQRRYLATHVAALPGWSSHLRWRQERNGGDTMLGFLAVAVATEAAIVGTTAWYTDDGPRPRPAAIAIDDRPLIWQDAYERTVHDSLLRTIDDASDRDEVDEVAAQVVCCIDVRSEGLRRNLERIGPYETFGYAGFFGAAVHVVPVSGRGGTDQFPVLIGASMTIHEVGSAPALDASAAMDGAWDAAKTDLVSPLALAEASGWAAGPFAAIKTVAPGFSARVADLLPHRRADRAAAGYDRSHLDVDAQASIVASLVGLGVGRARLVVLCGHGATADNNPMESGLACGACGGHDGAANARIVAAMANDPAVRSRLEARGSAVGADTWFVAGEHNTTTDRIRLFDTHLAPGSHRDALEALAVDLDRAGEAAAMERATTLPGGPRSLRAVRRRARNWAEPAAELGLAGNMAFVIGPRTLTRHADLGRRVFLHSYDATRDPDGTTLHGILTAPLVVAQWINAQYFFSTTDPDIFGSGSKAVHNVVADIGVLSGPGGDLRRGLPLQSVRAGSRFLHEPVRLLAVVEGSTDHIDRSLAQSPTLERLVTNEWIHLVARPAPGAPWSKRTAQGWEPYEPVHQDRAWPSAV
ncbi:MAG: hypothetical protein JWO77_3835 [Ilumatobacteraceae bacterium]|nr:hypothetical protein [Ilumatobacteraceae bacterium]